MGCGHLNMGTPYMGVRCIHDDVRHTSRHISVHEERGVGIIPYPGFCSEMVALMMGMLTICTQVEMTSAGRALSGTISSKAAGGSGRAWLRRDVLDDAPCEWPLHADRLEHLLALLRAEEDGVAGECHACLTQP